MIEKVSLFNSKRDYFFFCILCLSLLFISLSLEFYNYKELTKFDSKFINATVLKQYQKTKLTKKGKLKRYQVLKLKSDKGFTFYTTTSIKRRNMLYKKIKIEAWAGKISFYEYIHGFFAFSKIIKVYKGSTLKQKLNRAIELQHKNSNISAIYKALYTATPLKSELQKRFSQLGLSHLIAISGFHLGVLSALLFFLIKYPYKFLQNRYFPYRSYSRDTFLIISIFLLTYLLFLGSPPSLLRAFVMLIIGFFLYDRGVEIISMQTLLITFFLILSIFPRLLFSVGFWLSISGVFYIFLFLIHFKSMSKVWQFLLIPFWVYLLMLPYSLVIFGNFGLYHPLSMLWTSLFSIFYPLSIVLHIFHLGNWLDFALKYLLSLDTSCMKIVLNSKFLGAEILLSLLALYKKRFVYLLLVYVMAIFFYALSLVPF